MAISVCAGDARLKVHSSSQVFMNVATGGFGTEITAQTDSGLKDKLGGAAYLITGMCPYL